MATTKLFHITSTERKAISYIADGNKTDNGRLISTFCCSSNPAQASRDFASVRACGTGKNKILSQHFIQSFKPGEITPERALQLGQEICEQFLKGEYQYFMACHIDKKHTHLHVVFNNTNCIDGRTFETHENRHTTKQDRSFQKLMNITDSVCKRHHLFVIQHLEQTKGKSYWEWGMTRQGLSLKAKLKYAIDQVVKISESFEDFLQKCAEYGILAEYNPEHKIDLKFMLAEQKENNPRAKMTRAKTLGWYYETKQIKDRIAMYQGVMIYTPKTKIKQITQKPENKFIQDAIDRGNMKLASIAKNIIADYGIEPEQIHQASLSAYAHSRHLLSDLNNMKTEIEDLQTKINVLKKYRKLKVFGDELKALSGRQEKKYRNEHLYELSQLSDIRAKVLEIYPSGRIPTVESLEQKIIELRNELSSMDSEFRKEDKIARELADAQRTIEEYLRQEQSRDQQIGKMRNDLE